MQDTTRQPSAEVDTLAVMQAYQDRLIARRLPGWFASLSEGEFHLLGDTLRELLACRQRLLADFARVQSIDTFARPLLQQALERWGSFDVDQLYFRRWYYFFSREVSYLAGRYPVQDSNCHDLPLLEAALYNFTEQECSDQPSRNTIVDGKGGRQGSLPVLAFASLCRELDLGQRYQAHLDMTLANGAGRHGVRSSLADFQRHGMLADALQAKAQGALSDSELQWVIDLCRGNRLGPLGGAPVKARQLQLFHCSLQRIVVFEVIDEGVVLDTIKRVLVYVPGDPQGPWSARDNLEDYSRRVLGQRLRDASYRRFFSRFVRRRDSQRFFAAIGERLDDVAAWATRNLDEQSTGRPLPLFDHLADDWIAQIKDDAAVVAPPVAQLDRQVQAEHDQRLRAEGETLLGMAALYVPAIGMLLAAVMVFELLQEAFQAIGDWHDDERDAALDHLLNVGKQLVKVGVTAATVTVARRGWQQMDHLIAARLQDGSEKLWNGDLQPYRDGGPPGNSRVDEHGIHRSGAGRWIEMQGHWYRVTRSDDDAPWRLLPYQGHSPELRHNAAGAWRLWYESPAEWTDTRLMFRRLGRPFSELDDQQVDQVMTIHDFTDDHLRALHVYGRRAPARLADTVSRVILAGRIQRLIQRLRDGLTIADTALLAMASNLDGAAGRGGQALADALWPQRRVLLRQLYEAQFPDTEASALLRRDFISLHRLAADEILASASEEERESLLRTRRVPVFLAQAARSQVIGIRLARLYEALAFDTPQGLDLARVVLQLLERLPGSAMRAGWRLFDGDASQALLTIQGNGAVADLIHRDGLFSWRDASGQIVVEAGELFEVLAQAHARETFAVVGLDALDATALRARLLADAANQREMIIHWLGTERLNTTFLAPQRFDDGRLGYPLSGGRFWATLGGRTPRALQARLRDLYPAFSDEQIGRWLETGDAQARLELLEQQYNLLSSHLSQWVRTALLSLELFARREFRKALIDCWRWLIPELANNAPEFQRYLFSQAHSRIRHLPSLPTSVSFPHVSMLVLRAMRLQTVPDEFLRAFPNLRSLEVTECQLRRLPLPGALAEQLEVLDLSTNQITLDESQALVLAGCRSLVYLNLSSNPLTQAFSIFAMDRLNALILRRTLLDTFPYGIVDSPELQTLDLRDNSLYQLPDGFHQSQLWREGRVNLHGNPLPLPHELLSVWHWLGESRVPYRLRWLDVVPLDRRTELATLWTQLEGRPGAGDFFDTLAALTASGNFKSVPLARNFAVRLLDMLECMTRDDVLQKELFEHAAVTDCQDNATVRFTDLELRVLIWRARHGELARQPECALLHLGGQLWRLHMLDQLAAEHALRAGASTESIEFALAYRIALRSKLDLPIQQDDMLYFGIPNLKPHDIYRARQAVKTAQTREGLAQFLAGQTFWQDYLKAHFSARLRVPEQLHDELQRLIDLGGQDAEIARLQLFNQTREHEVMVQLSREAMGRAGIISLDVP